MDNLTHGLLGLAVGALRRPEARGSAPLTPTDRAALLGSVLAAELPDLDYLWPATDPVLHTLKAHRGLSHSLLAAPLIAAAAALLALACYRQARLRAIYPSCLAAVLFAHLLADAWTGWGTRLLLPFSAERVALDWMMVLDPLFTLPLALGALLGRARRSAFRPRLLAGAAVALGYLALRIGAQEAAEGRVRAAYPEARGVLVFPSWLGVGSFRYVSTLDAGYALGRVGLISAPREQGRFERSLAPNAARLAPRVPALGEALAWARFPVMREARTPDGGLEVEIADLRYHSAGQPTLRFVLLLDASGALVDARMDRGGSVRSLLERLRTGE